MFLNRLVFRFPLDQLAYWTSIRRASTTIAGASGRVYVQGELVRRHHKDPQLNIFKAESGNEFFVFKRVSRPYYETSQRIAAEFAGSRRLRVHVDSNQEEGVLFYPYFRDTLFSLIQNDPEFPILERKKIHRCVGEALQELHSKDWIHIDIKPDNILVNWTCDNDGNKTVSEVVLGDFDIAFKSENGRMCQTPYPIGNVMWRSLEGQTGRGVTKASDIFSFGLVCIYALGGADLLLLEHPKELEKQGIIPEQLVLIRHFSYFGLVNDGLLRQVDSEHWSNALKEASEAAEKAVKEQPELRFGWWGKELSPAAQNMISGMTNVDPRARLTIDEVMAHPWWEEVD